MYPQEVEFLDEALSGLTDAITSNAACHLNSKHVETIVGVLERWPASQRFPSSSIKSFPLNITTTYFHAYGLSCTQSSILRASFVGSVMVHMLTRPSVEISSPVFAAATRRTHQIHVSSLRPSLVSCSRSGGLMSESLRFANRSLHAPVGSRISKALRAARYLSASRVCRRL